MANGDWTRDEVEATVADYFVMLESELRGESYSKAEHNRRLQQIIGRSRGSVEFKHQNISAVLTRTSASVGPRAPDRAAPPAWAPR